MRKWKLKRTAFQRVATGHPWVFSNELDQSPKGIEPGELIELYDAEDRYIGIGFGHPQNLISFRFLTRSSVEINADYFRKSFDAAVLRRRQMGLQTASCRLIFGEADGFPGLIVDRYLTPSRHQILAIQINSAGLDKMKDVWLPELIEAACHGFDISRVHTAVVWANDSSARQSEGLKREAKSVFADFEDSPRTWTWTLVPIILAPLGASEPPHVMHVDLIGGQKTGFFLDQRTNVQLLWSLIQGYQPPGGRPVRVLDLFCYVGQWSSYLAAALTRKGLRVEVTAVDASADALTQARRNIEDAGAEVKAIKADIVEGLDEIPIQAFDIVICDPPAFIKQKKDITNGKQAYFKVNRQALRRSISGGFFISCSCSAHLSEEDFRETLTRASASQRIGLKLYARGGYSVDLPQVPAYNQGSYLKCWVGQTDWDFFPERNS